LKNRNKGFSLIEILLALTIFSLITMIIVRLYFQTQTSIRKSQQLTDLQQLAKGSLDQVAGEIRQTIAIRTTQAGDIPVGSNFTLSANGTNQVVIFIPKITNPRDVALADQITYKMGTYNGQANRLLQQLTTYKRNISGNVVVDTAYPLMPIMVNMDSFRKNPINASEGPLIGLFSNRYYSYETVTFFWDYNADPDAPHGLMALGLTVSVKDNSGRVQNRLSLTTVMTSRPITGVPR
jgi:prepilin-type N-terminal cleavage/methylation domain-containing protein